MNNNNEFSPVARAPRVTLFDGKGLRFSTSTRTYNSSNSTGSSSYIKSKEKRSYSNDSNMRSYSSSSSICSSRDNNNEPEEYIFHKSISRSQSQETEKRDANEKDPQNKRNNHLHRSVGQTRETGTNAKNVNQSILDMLLSIAQSTNLKTPHAHNTQKEEKTDTINFSRVAGENKNKEPLQNVGLNTSHELSYSCTDDTDNADYTENNIDNNSEFQELCNVSHSLEHVHKHSYNDPRKNYINNTFDHVQNSNELVSTVNLHLKEEKGQLSIRSSHKELVELSAENKERWALCVEWQRKAQNAEEEAMRWHTALMNERSMQENSIKELSTKALIAEESVQHATSQLERLSEKLHTVQSTLAIREATLEEMTRCNKATLLEKELLEKERKAYMEQLNHLESENKHLGERCQESAKEYVKLQSSNMKLSAQINALQASHRLEHHQQEECCYLRNSEESQEEKHNELIEQEQQKEEPLMIKQKVEYSEENNNHSVVNANHREANNDVNDSYNEMTNLFLLEYKEKNEELELTNTRLEARLSATINELHRFISNDVEVQLIMKEIAKRAEKVLHLINESVNKINEHLSGKTDVINVNEHSSSLSYHTILTKKIGEASTISKTEQSEQRHNGVHPCVKMAKSINSALDAITLFFIEEHEKLMKEIETKECEHYAENTQIDNNVMFIEEQHSAIEQENTVLIEQISELQETLENLQIKLNEWRTEEHDALYFLQKQNDMLCRALNDCHRVVYGNLSNHYKYTPHRNLLTSSKNNKVKETYAQYEKNTSREDQQEITEQKEEKEEEEEELKSYYNVKTLAKTNYYNTCTILSIIRELRQQLKLLKEQQKKIKAKVSEEQQMQQSKAEENVIALSHELNLSRDLVQKLKTENAKLQSQEELLYKEHERKLKTKEEELENADNKVSYLETELSALHETNSHLEQRLQMQQHELQQLQEEREHPLCLELEHVQNNESTCTNNNNNEHDVLSKLQIAFLEAIQCIMLLQRKVNYWQVHKRLMWRIHVCEESQLTAFHRYVDYLSNHRFITSSISEEPFHDDNNNVVCRAQNAKHYKKRRCLRIVMHVIRASIRLKRLMGQTNFKKYHMLQIAKDDKVNPDSVCKESSFVQIATSNKTFILWLDQLVRSATATQNLPKLTFSVESIQENKSRTMSSGNNEKNTSTSSCSNLIDALQYVYIVNSTILDEEIYYNNAISDGNNSPCTSWNALEQLDEYIAQLRSECTQCKEKYYMNEEDMCVLLEQNNTLSTMLCCVENERNALQEQLQSLHKEVEGKEELMEEVGKLQGQLEQVHSRLENERIAHRCAEERVDEFRKEEVKFLLEIEELKNVIRILECRLHESLLQTQLAKVLPDMHHTLELQQLYEKKKAEHENENFLETHKEINKNAADQRTASCTKNGTINIISDIDTKELVKDFVHTPKPQLLPQRDKSKQQYESNSLLLHEIRTSSATPPSLLKTTSSSPSSSSTDESQMEEQ